MIRKKLDQIVKEDLQYLVDNSVQERKTLEYKATLPDNSDSDKKEFLADVSSLANTEGGDLVFGIRESNGVLESDIGLEVTNADAEIARIENILRDGISPRLSVDMRVVEVSGNKKVIILRTKASLEAPHRVIFKGHDKFYKRNSNGKYPIDVGELRSSFLQSGEITDRIRRFRLSRISDIKAGDTPFPLASTSSFITIHVLPLSSFSTSFRIDAKSLLALKEGGYSNLFSPFASHGWHHRINLDGVVAYSTQQEVVRKYTQMYRDGRIEAVECDILPRTDTDRQKILPMYYIEDQTMKCVVKMLRLLSEFELQPPFFVFLSLVGVRGFTVSKPRDHFFLDTAPITQNELLLPEAIIESASENLQHKFRPIFDMIWNAAGVSRSLHFDDSDNFIEDR
jgi:Putative DNA-binding domain